jgi:hypothetical protein
MFAIICQAQWYSTYNSDITRTIMMNNIHSYLHNKKGECTFPFS